MYHMNRTESLNTLAEIRDYLRERVGIIPQGICDDFNKLAAHLGEAKLTSSWCTPEFSEFSYYAPGHSCIDQPHQPCAVPECEAQRRSMR
jgi:hypothetical protein